MVVFVRAPRSGRLSGGRAFNELRPRSSSYDPARHRRRSIRLREYDYAQPGYYFVTINVQDHLPLLGEIRRGEVELSRAGWVIEWWWQDVPKRFRNVALDAFVVMPDHFHGIREIEQGVRTQ